MRPLRFCMVTTFYPPHNFGGDGISVRRLSRALARRGHEVEVIHDVDAWRAVAGGSEEPSGEEPSGEEPSGEEPSGAEPRAASSPAEPSREEPAGDEGVTVHPLESGWGRLSPLLTHQTGRPVANGGRIREILRRGRFDVVNFHNVSLVGGPGVLSLWDGPSLYTAHEHWLVCPTHVLWRHDREPCTGRECLRCLAHHRRPPQAWRHTGWLERQLEHVDVLLARSEFSRARHREFGLEREMTVLPDFLPDTAPPVANRPHPRPYFLFAGRLEKLKGVQSLLPAFREISGADLVVAGEGSYGPELRRRAEEVPGVRFLGRLDPEELRAWYRHAVALLAPTLGFETFGLTLIEAFREGTPVVARRRGPFPEIVEACDGGLLFDDTRELVRTLRSLLARPGLRARLGERAREGFRRRWTEDAVLPRYLEIAREAMARRNDGSRAPGDGPASGERGVECAAS